MNIMVPISRYEDIVPFSNAGADEFYFGIRDEKWNNKFGIFEEINRMSSFGSRANFDINNVNIIVSKVKEQGKKVYMTLNSGVYSTKQIEYITRNKNIFKNIDGIIVSDLGMIKELIKLNLPIILSTMAGLYNSSIIQFYYKLGIRRMIIPRDVQLRDIVHMVKKYPDIKFEVFLMRNGCKYSDSNCMSFHGRKYGSMCSCIDNEKSKIIMSEKIKNDTNIIKEIYSNNKLFTKAYHKEACGLCALEVFNNIGINSLKVVGRADNPASIINDIKQIKRIINELNKGEELKISNYDNCLYNMNCYYNMQAL